MDFILATLEVCIYVRAGLGGTYISAGTTGQDFRQAARELVEGRPNPMRVHYPCTCISCQPGYLEFLLRLLCALTVPFSCLHLEIVLFSMILITNNPRSRPPKDVRDLGNL